MGISIWLKWVNPFHPLYFKEYPPPPPTHTKLYPINKTYFKYFTCIFIKIKETSWSGQNTVFKFGYIWVQHDKDQSHEIILQTNIYTLLWGGGGVGYLNIFFKAIFSNEGVTQLEKAVYFRKKQKNNKLLELWSDLYPLRSVLKIKRLLLCTILLSRLIVHYLQGIPFWFTQVTKSSGVFKHFKTDGNAEWPLVLKKLKEGVHIKWLSVRLISWEVPMKSYQRHKDHKAFWYTSSPNSHNQAMTWWQIKENGVTLNIPGF